MVPRCAHQGQAIPEPVVMELPEVVMIGTYGERAGDIPTVKGPLRTSRHPPFKCCFYS
jgi:hypothetical protein